MLHFLSSISSGLEFLLAKHTSMYKNGIKLFKNIKILGELSSNLPNDLLEINVYKNLESCW